MNRKIKLSDIGEFGLIERIRKGTVTQPDVVLGIGDDCAAVVLPATDLLLTSTDLLLESVHFCLDWTDWFMLGRKCVSVNVSDIAAMGGTPRYITLGLGLTQNHPLDHIEQFFAGVRAAAKNYDVALIGGDTCRSPGPLFIAVTILGSIPPAEMISRAGAHAGELLYVTGTIGDSALALAMLQRGEHPPDALAQRHYNPVARTLVGRELARHHLATAMLDISDGLLGDLEHLLTASAVGCRLDGRALPLSEAFAAFLPNDPELLNLALNGGEDYELLFSSPAEKSVAIEQLSATTGLPITCIGTLSADPAARQITDHLGRVLDLPAKGYNHFRD